MINHQLHQHLNDVNQQMSHLQGPREALKIGGV